MFNLSEELKNVKKVAISGHIRPDGDCLGSTLGLRSYILDNFPGVEVSVYLLAPIPLDFKFLRGYDEIKLEYDGSEVDLFISCDCGAVDRLNSHAEIIKHSRRVLCIDHHEPGQIPVPYDESYIDPPASSTCELVYNLLDKELISKSTAECLYTGMVHDTGKFQYNCCHRSTMEAAGFLMDKGIDYTWIIDETFNFKTYTQLKLLGYAIDKAELRADGDMIVTVLTLADFEKFGANSKDTEGIVQKLRETKGVRVAAFIYETEPGDFKGSMRCTDETDLSVVCAQFGGGGHKKAAGFSTTLPVDEIIKKLEELIK